MRHAPRLDILPTSAARPAPAAALALALWLVLAGPVPAQTPHTHHHDFKGAAGWSAVFDDPARDAWQKPHEVITALAPAADARVADIGAGTGYFAVRLAHMVPKGRIYAVDLEPDMVRHLADRAKQTGVANLQAVQAAADDARLPEPVDLVLMVDTYHHIEARPAYFRRLATALRPGARVAIIDFRPDSPVGPPPAARLPPATVVREMADAGYVPVARHDFLPNQYFLVFGRK